MNVIGGFRRFALAWLPGRPRRPERRREAGCVLVKSHLIARATDTALAVGKWNQVTDVLKDAGGKYEEDLESFLLHYFGSRYGKTTKGSFFADYRPQVGQSDALAVLDEIIESARFYRSLVDPAGAATFWSTLGTGARQAAELMNGLGLKQLRYLLLAVLRDFGVGQAISARRKKQRDAIIRIAAWSLRGLVHGKTGGGDAEKTYITAARAIRVGDVTSVSALRDWFVSRDMLLLDDALFKQEFLRFSFDSAHSHRRARSVLYALEYHKVSDKSGLVPRDTLTLEHVLPQSVEGGQWSAFTEDERRMCTYQLGNLLLVDGPSGANSLLGNLEWPEKRKLIRSWGNQTPMTEAALKFPQWTKSTIDKRTSLLADVAVSAWSA